MSEASTERQLPRYKCHKEVYALKIAGLQPVVGGAVIITPAEAGYLPFRAEHPYAERHKPEIGGYFVVYDGDGYHSYSPAKAFEEGYTLI